MVLYILEKYKNQAQLKFADLNQEIVHAYQDFKPAEVVLSKEISRSEIADKLNLIKVY